MTWERIMIRISVANVVVCWLTLSIQLMTGAEIAITAYAAAISIAALWGWQSADEWRKAATEEGAALERLKVNSSAP